eukprot:gnl/MRDRNA2_/MRDRNA2_62315_c0_seq1.p1 gnl/MRDRNA2_/MRDRNA2_62315_c0~~gnl/MRDRNA2_/MRDRNA2_62315_c0_seq1.p1  ORF type:complete len:229 (+),score=32.68 gnl/MRDRNA2_/MRDRNA2_62315_c0_seq1:87-773(+)
MSSALNLYATLGVTPSASSEDVRQAYRALALKWHPDKLHERTKNNPRHLAIEQATRRFQEVQGAYEVLADPDRRRLYDEELFKERCATAPQSHGRQRCDPRDMTTAHMVDEMQRLHREEQGERPATGRMMPNRMVEDICSLYRDQLEGLADALGVPRKGLQSRDAILTVLLTRLSLTGVQAQGSTDGSSARLQRRAHAWLARERAMRNRSKVVHSFTRHRDHRDPSAW